MLKNYLKTACRNLLKNKTYSLLNIAGLAIGFASCLLILMYVRHELSYDKFHPNSGRIYRVGHVVGLGAGVKEIASSPYRLAPTLATDFSELEKVTHFSRLFDEQVEYKGRVARENRIAFADSVFFQIFNFDFVEGDRRTALYSPNQVVVTESMARKYFGEEEPLGQRLKIGAPYSDDQMELAVSGVIRDMPENAHFHMNFLISMPTGKNYFPDALFSNWGWDSHYTYAVAPQGYRSREFTAKLMDFGGKHIQGDWFVKFFAQKADDIHLRSNLNSEIEANGDMNYIYIFSIVAGIILLIACVNYMNLATARSINRSKEVGVRKAIGAQRKQIILQFFSESLLIILLALVASFVLAQLARPVFNRLSGKNIAFLLNQDLFLVLGFILLALFVGIVSASYPAFFLSSFRPVIVLKGTTTKLGTGSLLLRKGLVTLQFAISIVLISGSAIVYQQLEYLRNKKLGADVEQVVVAPSQTSNLRNQFETFKTELLRNPNITAVTTAGRRVGRDINSATVFRVENENNTITKARISNIQVGWDFFDFYDLKLVAGRAFSKEFASDTTINATVINETAAKVLGLEPSKAIGKTIRAGENFTATIVGVTKDFHFEALYNPIKPMAFRLSAHGGFWNSIKITGENVPEMLAYIESVWKQFAPQRIFRSSFLDESLHNLYRAEERFLTVFSIFTSLAILTGCLGIFGLASFAAAQRTREIGIRKVLGASVVNVVTLLSKELTILVGLAFLIAAPVAYLTMNSWLANFAYRTTIGMQIFLVAGLAALLIAWLTVGFQAIRAAVANPVESLRYE